MIFNSNPVSKTKNKMSLEIFHADKIVSIWLKQVLFIIFIISTIFMLFQGFFVESAIFLFCTFLWFVTIKFDAKNSKITYTWTICNYIIQTCFLFYLYFHAINLKEFTVLWLLILVISSLYILGFIWGLLFVILYTILIVSTMLVNINIVSDFDKFYSAGMQTRLPFIFIAFILLSCFLSYDIRHFIQNKENYRLVLKDTIISEEMKMHEMNINVVLALVEALSKKLPRNKLHSENVGKLNKSIALQLGLNAEEATNMYYAGLLHDIGKIAYPDSFWDHTTQNTLNPEDYENYKNHTVQGEIILKDLQMMNGLADASMYHHERMDGKGYPVGLAGEEIPLVARITSVSNKIDNKIHEGLNVEEIVAYLEINAGSKFDAEVVEVATNVLRYSNVFKMH